MVCLIFLKFLVSTSSSESSQSSSDATPAGKISDSRSHRHSWGRSKKNKLKRNYAENESKRESHPNYHYNAKSNCSNRDRESKTLDSIIDDDLIALNSSRIDLNKRKSMF